MEGGRQPQAEAVSIAISKVLDDENLLIEILVRVGLPTTLVSAALVCKQWLRHVSGPKFLHRFCKLHPPRLLGFYINGFTQQNTMCFIPMKPQPPELTAVIRRARFSLDCGQNILTTMRDCRNGRVFATHRGRSGLKHGVYNPLFPERGMSIIPPFPSFQGQADYLYSMDHLLSVKEGDGLSYLYVLVESNSEKTKSIVHVYMLRPGDGFWRMHLTLSTDPLSTSLNRNVVLVDNRIYMPGFLRDIIVLDLIASSFSTIHLPQGVEYRDGDTMLSQADDASSVYLIQAKERQLCIWLHEGNNWLLVDTISMTEMVANLRMSDCTVEEDKFAVLRIKQVGDNVEFVFLQMGRYVFYLDIKCRTLRKVYDMTSMDHRFPFYIYPFKMIWPPTFPPAKDDPSRNAL